MSETEFVSFGNRNTFSIEARFFANNGNLFDLENGYGEFRIFVKKICLSRHTTPRETRDEIRWYLRPLLEWLGREWLPLFHEQRLPSSIGTHDNTIIRFEQGERLLFDDASTIASAKRQEMQDWRKRHSLWTAAAGGIFPNIWFRRQSDLMEISYDPGTTVGGQDCTFHFNRGSRLLDADDVAEALKNFIEWGVTALSLSDAVLPRQTSNAAHAAQRWMLGEPLADLFENLTTKSAPTLQSGILYPLTAEVAMFGTLTPQTTPADAETLFAALQSARSNIPESGALSKLTRDVDAPSRDSSWEQGYELAIETLESLSYATDRPIDLTALLSKLNISVSRVSVSDRSLRGVAIAGPGFTPTIFVNETASWNKTEPGRRFTIAHELAHILLDRGAARQVTHSSTPWAPEAVERRANAFAAMFLMPYVVVDKAIKQRGPISDLASLKRVVKILQCGRSAVLEHLKNIDRLDEFTYYNIKAQMSR